MQISLDRKAGGYLDGNFTRCNEEWVKKGEKGETNGLQLANFTRGKRRASKDAQERFGLLNLFGE